MSDSTGADTYTHGHHEAVLRAHRWRTAENSAAYLLPHLRPGMSLLDVGCGPGTLTADLAARVAPGAVLGIDLSTAVVAEAEAHARDAGVPNLRFRSGDFRSAGLAERGFDVVHAHQVLQHLRDPVGALRAMGRLARRDGIVAARDGDYSAMVWWPADPRLDRWREIYLEVTRRNGAEADAGRRLAGWAAEAGLADVAYSTSTWTFATTAERGWWSELWAERTTSSSLGRQAVEYGIATPSELAGVAAGWRAFGAAAGGVFIVVSGEIIARP
ncbi:MAG: methyltransferase domain-containing protein [Candidatus Dormibacteria bacterium]|jgi:SAM-dependent methyltransferase